jgi:capsular polysaccharide export protein
VLAIVENVEEYGISIKKAVSAGLRKAGYTVILFGKGASFADGLIEYEHCESDFVALNADSYKKEIYQEIDLWSVCKGTLSYREPNGIDNDHIENLGAVSKVYAEAISYYEKVKNILEKDRPDIVIVWGGMFFEGQILTKLAARLDIPSYAIEYSFDKERIFFDEAGVIANRHSFARAWDFLRTIPLQAEQSVSVKSWVAENYKGKSANQPQKGIPESVKKELISKDKPNILLLGQCFIDSVVQLDNPHFSTTLEAYQAVASEVMDIDARLILKTHPGDKPEITERIKEIFSGNKDIKVIAPPNDLNVYSLMDICDVGITINSQAGLEMLAKHKRVLTLGDAFYGGKGFNLHLSSRELLGPSIRHLIDNPHLNDEEVELVERYLFYFLNNYLVKKNEIANVIPNILDQRNPFSRLVGGNVKAKPKSLGSKNRSDANLRVLITHPSPRWGGSGYYLQEIASFLKKSGVEVLVLSEGSCPPSDEGVMWRKLRFEGIFLARELKDLIYQLNPNVIYQVGVRTKPMRAAIEALIMTNARLTVQAEDDEFVPFRSHYPTANQNMALLNDLDKKNISSADVKEFARNMDWGFLHKVIRNPNYYRWVEPLMRVICYHLADFHTAIWYPMADRLSNRFGKPVYIVPPVIKVSDFDPTPLSSEERTDILSKYKIKPESLVYFLAGTIYDFSNEYECFLDALVLAQRKSDKQITLVVAGRGRKSIHAIARKKLKGKVYYRSLGTPPDEEYFEMMKACDVVCTPGFPDEFNRYRLSSRLVKAMAFAKPIFTYKTGFGESLVHGENAFLTSGSNVDGWAEVILESMDPVRAEYVGIKGREFAEANFDSESVAINLMSQFEGIQGLKWESAEENMDGFLKKGRKIKSIFSHVLRVRKSK